MKNKFSLMLVLLTMSFAFSACSNDNDEPLPPPEPDVPTDTLAPGELPMLETVPTEFTDDAGMTYDTIPFSWAGMHDNFNPAISIWQITENGRYGISQAYDHEIYLEDEDNNKYRIGDKLPLSDAKAPFDHIIIPSIYSEPEKYGPLALGCFPFTMDKSYVLNWPEKNLKVFIRIYSKRYVIRLSDGSLWEENVDYRDPDGAQIFRYGMYVNGKGMGSILYIKVEPDGKVRLFTSYDAMLDTVKK